MIVSATQAALEQPKELCRPQPHGTHFAELIFPEAAPWLYSALAHLWELERAGNTVRGLGDFRIAANTGVRVRQTLSRIGRVKYLPVPFVNVFSGGGITLTWSVGQRDVKFSFWPEGTLTYWKEEGGETVGGDEIAADQPFDPSKPIEWLFT